MINKANTMEINSEKSAKLQLGISEPVNQFQSGEDTEALYVDMEEAKYDSIFPHKEIDTNIYDEDDNPKEIFPERVEQIGDFLTEYGITYTKRLADTNSYLVVKDPENKDKFIELKYNDQDVLSMYADIECLQTEEVFKLLRQKQLVHYIKELVLMNYSEAVNWALDFIASTKDVKGKSVSYSSFGQDDFKQDDPNRYLEIYPYIEEMVASCKNVKDLALKGYCLTLDDILKLGQQLEKCDAFVLENCKIIIDTTAPIQTILPKSESPNPMVPLIHCEFTTSDSSEEALNPNEACEYFFKNIIYEIYSPDKLTVFLEGTNVSKDIKKVYSMDGDDSDIGPSNPSIWKISKLTENYGHKWSTYISSVDERRKTIPKGREDNIALPDAKNFNFYQFLWYLADNCQQEELLIKDVTIELYSEAVKTIVEAIQQGALNFMFKTLVFENINFTIDPNEIEGYIAYIDAGMEHNSEFIDYSPIESCRTDPDLQMYLNINTTSCLITALFTTLNLQTNLKTLQFRNCNVCKKYAKCLMSMFNANEVEVTFE